MAAEAVSFVLAPGGVGVDGVVQLGDRRVDIQARLGQPSRSRDDRDEFFGGSLRIQYSVTGVVDLVMVIAPASLQVSGFGQVIGLSADTLHARAGQLRTSCIRHPTGIDLPSLRLGLFAEDDDGPVAAASIGIEHFLISVDRRGRPRSFPLSG